MKSTCGEYLVSAKSIDMLMYLTLPVRARRDIVTVICR